MKRILAACMLMAISAIFVTACGQKRYVIVTDDYGVHESVGKPVVDGDAGTITFKDKDGAETSIPRDRVKEMHELK